MPRMKTAEDVTPNSPSQILIRAIRVTRGYLLALLPYDVAVGKEAGRDHATAILAVHFQPSL